MAVVGNTTMVRADFSNPEVAKMRLQAGLERRLFVKRIELDRSLADQTHFWMSHAHQDAPRHLA
jgi:hypothetical protein